MKYIFLDQKIWIDLRRYLNNEPNSPDLSSFVVLLNSKIEAEEWAIPLLQEHIDETRTTRTDSLRYPLIKVMLDYSKGYTIQNYLALREYEVEEFINGRDAWMTPEKVIIQDPGNIFGVSAAERLDAFLQEEGVEKDSAIYKKMHEIYPALIKSSPLLGTVMSQPHDLSADKEAETKTLEYYQKFGEEPELNFVFSRIRDYYTIEQQAKILTHGKTKLTHHSKQDNRSELDSLLRKLPTFYTNCTLIYKDIHMQPKGKRFHKNDFIDMLYMSAAIPYCDIVITEAKWVDLAKQAKLDRIYNTELFSSVRELERAIL